MVSQIPLFDSAWLARLQGEFRRSMRGLLFDLCDDLAEHYPAATERLRLPLGLFRLVGRSLGQADYGTWKVVGWIDLLNDLVYFVDLAEQYRREGDRAGFAEALAAECQEKLFENSYADDLFPQGLLTATDQAGKLGLRIERLCRRLARQVTQESVLLVPGLPCRWLRQTGRSSWSLPFDPKPNFEQADWPGCVPIGLAGAALRPAVRYKNALGGGHTAWRIVVRRDGVTLAAGRTTIPLMTGDGRPKEGWTLQAPIVVRQGLVGEALTLGPALVYGKDMTPHRLAAPPARVADRIGLAWDAIQISWPEGASLLRLFTSRLVPLQARGVVSFSYRHRPGLSFINTFERDQLDLIDDLIHENSHHHLNLLLRKYELRRGDHNQRVFYSPWRRSLRPLHGILHATFTFTMGASLFERLSSWAEREGAADRLRGLGLTERDILRARVRCLEEVASVRYSLHDLRHVAHKLGWLSRAGVGLVEELSAQTNRVARRIARHRAVGERSRFGPTLRKHVRTLQKARATYPLPSPKLSRDLP